MAKIIDVECPKCGAQSRIPAGRKGLYREKYEEALHLRGRFANIRFRWVPREENEEADGLTREAYKNSMHTGPPGVKIT